MGFLVSVGKAEREKWFGVEVVVEEVEEVVEVVEVEVKELELEVEKVIEEVVEIVVVVREGIGPKARGG